MSVERNKAAVQRYVAAFNAGDWNTLRLLFAENVLIQGVLGVGRLEFAFGVWRELHDSLCCHLRIDSMVCEGNTVAVRYTETGKFIKPCSFYQGVEPTGLPYLLVAMEWFTLDESGQITSRWGARDAATQARQIGAMLT